MGRDFELGFQFWGYIRDEWLWPTLVTSATYSALVWLTLELVSPLQRQLLPGVADIGLVLFLPHGVRILSAWLYGWKSILHLLPGSAFGAYLVFGPASFSSPVAWTIPLVSICGYIGILTMRSTTRARAKLLNGRDLNWKQIILAGVMASLVDSAGHLLIFGFPAPEVFAFLIGDTLGTVALLFGLVFVLRLWRTVKTR